MAVAALQACARDKARSPLVRAEAVYSIGKVKPSVPKAAQFLMNEITPDAEPEVAILALAALLQIEPPVDRPINSWLRSARALHPLCVQIDEHLCKRTPELGMPRAVKYLEALVARWEATAGTSEADRR